MTIRNIIFLTGVTLFLIWYVGDWAYKTQYVKPRTELGEQIKKLSAEIEQGQQYIAAMTKFCGENQWYYARSLPPKPNDARSQYHFWLLELLQYSGLENNRVETYPPTSVAPNWNYRITIQCEGSLAQLSYFLFEFYYAPFLHRIMSMTLTPFDGNPDRLTFSFTVNALAMNLSNSPYPRTDQLPKGWYYPRLTFNDLNWYQTIANRNLLQTARGGIDQADYIVFTGMPLDGEVWFFNRLEDETVKKKMGDTIIAGSFVGRIVEIHDQDIVLDRNGARWLLEIGESLNQAFALPLESGEPLPMPEPELQESDEPQEPEPQELEPQEPETP